MSIFSKNGKNEQTFNYKAPVAALAQMYSTQAAQAVAEAPLPALGRKPLPEQSSSMTAASKQLAAEAKELLGYTVLSAKDEKEALQLRVQEVFKKLGFEPLDKEKVQKYKDERQRRESWRLQTLHGGHVYAQWTSCRLAAYSNPVPEFALSRALELKREIPEAEFHVEFMQYVRVDPFMLMHVGGEVYYLDVWEEPEFEGRRTV